jgi:hypothetical protein
MPPKFFPTAVTNLKKAGIDHRPMSRTSPYKKSNSQQNLLRREGEEDLRFAEVRALRLKEEEQKRWMTQQSKMKSTREIYSGGMVFVDPSLKHKKKKKVAAATTPVLVRKKVIEVPDYSSDPKIRQAQYDLVHLRKEMREKRMNMVDAERVLFREVYKLRETSRKAMQLISQGAKQKSNGDLLIAKLSRTVSGLQKKLELLESGVYPVADQKGEYAVPSAEEKQKTATLRALVDGMSNVNIVSLEDEKKQKNDRETLIAQEWEIMDEKSVNHDTIAAYDESTHELKKYMVFISERHHKSMKTLHKDIDEYLDINKKASGIVQTIASQKKERSLKRKGLKKEVETLTNAVKAKEEEYTGGDGGEDGDTAADAAAEPADAKAAEPAADTEAAKPAADTKAAKPAADTKAAKPAADTKAAKPAADTKAAEPAAAQPVADANAALTQPVLDSEAYSSYSLTSYTSN